MHHHPVMMRNFFSFLLRLAETRYGQRTKPHCPRLLRTYCAPILQTLLTRLRTTLHAPTASELPLALGAVS